MAGKIKNNQEKELKDIYGHITDHTQKLTAALYRVTDLMSDREPLKWTLRDTATHLHDNIMSIRFLKDKSRVLEDSLNDFFRIVKALELVSLGVYISNLNFEILKREYLNLKNFIEGKNKKIVAGDILVSIDSIKLAAPGGIKDIARPSLVTSVLKEKEGTDGVQKALNPENRKEKILEFLKTGGPKNVGEIGGIFNGLVSAKATQRDLLDLVKIGEVIAKGDKRWRTYESA